jgi:HEAT repeats/Putative zinc-finger
MICENAQQNMILAQYGELPDELQFPLEQHIAGCEDCRREWKALQALDEELALMPLTEPSPNLLAASRMRLDEMLDEMPPRSVQARFLTNFFRWMGTMQSAPALMTLLVGLGFLGGNFLTRYQVAHAPQPPMVVGFSNPNGPIASVSGIIATPNSDIVQVKYNRMVPEMMQGSLSDPKIRELLMLGTKLATNKDVHEDSVAVLADYCQSGHNCDGDPANGSSSDIRAELLRTLRYDKSPTVRMKALEGLQPYVGQDRNVRDAVLVSLMEDSNEGVRSRAISVLGPVQADSSVRQVLRTVSTQDENPAVRNASFQALQSAADIQ